MILKRYANYYETIDESYIVYIWNLSLHILNARMNMYYLTNMLLI